MSNINWGTLLSVLVQRFGPQPAVHDAEGTATYADIFAAAAGIGRHLRAAGVRPGEHVASLGRNNRRTVAAAYGIQLAGAAEAPLNISYTTAELTAITALAGCRHVVCAA